MKIQLKMKWMVQKSHWIKQHWSMDGIYGDVFSAVHVLIVAHVTQKADAFNTRQARTGRMRLIISHDEKCKSFFFLSGRLSRPTHFGIIHKPWSNHRLWMFSFPFSFFNLKSFLYLILYVLHFKLHISIIYTFSLLPNHCSMFRFFNIHIS